MASLAERRITRKKSMCQKEVGTSGFKYGENILVDKDEGKYKPLIDKLGKPFDELVKRTDMQVRARHKGR